MAFIRKTQDIRVIVELDEYAWRGKADKHGYYLNTEAQQSQARTIVEDIKRHVDGIGHVYVEHSQLRVCEFCGEPETNAVVDGLPQCCDEALLAAETEAATP